MEDSMITNVTHIPIFVEDQNDAFAFYTKKLGFVLHTDHTFNGMRWLTITTQKNPAFELILSLADTPEKKALVGKQAPGMPFIAVAVDDCHKTYDELIANNVIGVEKPQIQPWGLAAMVQDLYGNLLYLVQEQ